jgi:hypothetical protein
MAPIRPALAWHTSRALDLLGYALLVYSPQWAKDWTCTAKTRFGRFCLSRAGAWAYRVRE